MDQKENINKGAQLINVEIPQKYIKEEKSTERKDPAPSVK